MEIEIIIKIVGVVIYLLPLFIFYGHYLDDKTTSKGDITDWIQMYR